MYDLDFDSGRWPAIAIALAAVSRPKVDLIGIGKRKNRDTADSVAADRLEFLVPAADNVDIGSNKSVLLPDRLVLVADKNTLLRILDFVAHSKDTNWANSQSRSKLGLSKSSLQ